MDTFGRLPTDVIQLITNMVQLPTLDVIKSEGAYYLIIKYPTVTIYVDMQVENKDRLHDITDFIKKLKKNKFCNYRSFYYGARKRPYEFNIFVTNNIKIESESADIIMSDSSKDELIRVFAKYYEMLKNDKD